MPAEPRRLVLDQVHTRHVSRLFQAHDVEDRRSYVGQHTVLHLGMLVLRYIDKGNGVQRVSRVGRAVLVDGIVGITVVSNDDGFVAGFVIQP